MKKINLLFMLIVFLHVCAAAAGQKISLNPRLAAKQTHDCSLSQVPAPRISRKTFEDISGAIDREYFNQQQDRHVLHPDIDIEMDVRFKPNGFVRAQTQIHQQGETNPQDWVARNKQYPTNVTTNDLNVAKDIKNFLDGDKSILVSDDAGMAVNVDQNFANFLTAVAQKTQYMSNEAKLMVLSKIGDYLGDRYDFALPITPTSMEDMLTNARAGEDKGGVCRDIHQFINYVALAMGFEEVGLLTTNNYSEEDKDAVVHVYSYIRAKKGDEYLLINYSKIINTREKVLPQAMEIADRWTGHSNDSVMVEVTKKNGKKQLEMFIPSSSRWVISHLQEATCIGDAAAKDHHRCRNPKMLDAQIGNGGSFEVSGNIPFVTQHHETKKGVNDRDGKRGEIQSTLGIAGLGMQHVGRDEDRLNPDGSKNVFVAGILYGNSWRRYHLDQKGSSLTIGGGGHFGYSYKGTSMLGEELQGHYAGRHGVTFGLKNNAQLLLQGPRFGDWQLRSKSNFNFEMDTANQHVGKNLPSGDFTLPYWKREISSEVSLQDDEGENKHKVAIRLDHIGHVQFKSGDLYDFTGGIKNKTASTQISAIYHFEHGNTFVLTTEGTVMSLGGLTERDALGLRARLRLEAKDPEERIQFYLIAEASAVIQGKQDNQWFASDDHFLNIFVGAGGKLNLRKENIDGLTKATGSLYLTAQIGVEKGFAHPTMYLADRSAVDASGYHEDFQRNSNGTAPTMGQPGVNIQASIGIGGTFGLSAQERRRMREQRHKKRREKNQKQIERQYAAEIKRDHKKAVSELITLTPEELQVQLELISNFERSRDQ